RQGRQTIILALRPAIFDRDVLTFDVTGFTQPLAECGQGSRIGRGRCAVEKTDQRDRCLLRPRQDRPADGRRAAEQRDELAASHSITSSARNRNDSGIVRPSALAVLRLIASSNLTGCSTGRSAGLVPCKILCT